MACIDFDVNDYLHEASERALRDEVNDRIKEGRWRGEVPSLDENCQSWSSLGLADDLRTAFYARNASRFEMLVAILERTGPEQKKPRFKVAA